MKAILRVSKIKGAGSITGKSQHNYRLAEVPNADPQRSHLNHEYVNQHQHLAPAIEARLGEEGITKTRQDAVKGMEFILTASPEVFQRDNSGQIKGDYRQSKWVEQNLRFMQAKYGPNLVAFTLHQDEKTPHIHAVVVPITADGRLCAKELFNPQTLRRLQTDYAEAMKPFGLERGTEGSRARHVSMKQIYGLQQAERQSIEKDIKPDPALKQPLTIEKPGLLDLANLEGWKRQQEEKLNREYARRLAQMEKRAVKAQNAAVANATAKSEGKILRQKLNTAEGLKQANHQKAQQTAQKLTTTQATLEKVAVLLERGELSPQWSQQTAQEVRARVLPQMEADVLAVLKEPTHHSRQIIERLQAKGYTVSGGREPGKVQYLEHPQSGVKVDVQHTKFGGHTIREGIAIAIERTQQEEQKRQQKQSLNRGRGMRM